ncbi:Putative transmembrane protein DUF2311 [Candidatus Glomeribacter gigasporarum BEG34]|uniref:Putative transmembrane protein DUF2311 n=2 Tax=Candidatus Glomeribacter gigasporarum TaxID=132144 RepID=G2J8B9_9BURK|nr:Putative transmembrane protein DUF2311 [Candidatus Glomeribacter gigasporarum BEG34]
MHRRFTRALDQPQMKRQRSPLKRMFGAVCALARTRLELISIELSEEKERLFTNICICLTAAVFGMLSLMTLTALIVTVFWERYRWQVLAILTAMYSVIAVLCAFRVRARIRTAPPFFSATCAEFAKDCKALTESQ